MIQRYITAVVLLAFVAFAGNCAWQGNQIRNLKDETEALKTEATELRDALNAAENTVREEKRLRENLKRVTAAADQGVAEIEAIDPMCTNEAPLVDAWHAGIDRVREAAPEYTTDGDGAVPVATEGRGEDG